MKRARKRYLAFKKRIDDLNALAKLYKMEATEKDKKDLANDDKVRK